MVFVIDDIFAWVAIAAMTAGAASSVASTVQQGKSAKLERRAQQSQVAQQNMRAVRERQQTIRDARMRSAIAENNAGNQDVMGSSGAQGGQGSIISQLNTEVSFLDNQQGFAAQQNRFMDDASRHAQVANVWNSVSNLAFAAGSFAWGMRGTTQPIMLGAPKAADVVSPTTVAAVNPGYQPATWAPATQNYNWGNPLAKMGLPSSYPTRTR